MNTITRAVTVATMAGLLFGCATAAQRQSQAIGTNTRTVVASAQACVTAIYAAPEAAPLRPHLPFDVRELTLAQLSDQSLATKEEIDAIFLLHPRLQQCQKAALDGLMITTPSLVPMLATEYIKGEDNLLLLVQIKQSWGEFSKHRRDIVFEGQAQLVAEARRIEAGLEQSHETELAARQAAIQAVGNALERGAQTWQANVNANRPVFTNCMRMGYQGSMLNCTTY
ncbi:MAG: hypothetical protein WA459_16500 [Stellaceae bacterium]